MKLGFLCAKHRQWLISQSGQAFDWWLQDEETLRSIDQK